MKRIACIAVLLGFIGFLVVSSVSASGIKTDMEIGYYTDYIGGAGMVVNDGAVFQQSIMFSGKSAYFKIWNSISPKDGANSDFGDEVDLIIGNTTDIGKINLDIGAAYYNLYDLGEIEGDLFAVYVTLTCSKLYLCIEGDIPQDDDVLEGGVLYKLGVNHDFLEKTKYSFHSCALISGNDGLCGFKPEPVSYARLSLNKFFETKIGSFTPSINFQTKLRNDDGGAAEDRVWGGLTWSKTF